MSTLKIAISELVRTKERNLEEPLPPAEFEFVVNTNYEFITRNVDKYINGVVEHGPGFLTEVDHIDELYKELLDAVNFLAAIRLKTRKFDKRYEPIRPD